MPFFIAGANTDGSRNVATEVSLTPRPTRVEYPVEPLGTVIPVLGSAVVQQPIADNRIRSWIWEGYPGWMPAYQTLWTTLQPLRSRYRVLAGLSPYVYLRDTESTAFRSVAIGANAVVTESFPWVRVRVIEVSRRMRTQGSSLVVWEATTLKFVIEDPAFNDFG